MCRTRFTFISAVGRPYQKPSRQCGITDHVVSMLYTTNWFSSQSPRSAPPHRLYRRLPDSSLWQICPTLPRCLLMSTIWLVALVWCPTSINSCTCCCVRALLRKTHETSTSDASDGGPHESGGPNPINDKGTVPDGPCVTIALETSRQQFSLSADSRKAFI